MDEKYKAAILAMLEQVDTEQLKMIYEFLSHLTAPGP